MKWARFAAFDALGALLWATLFTMGGALLGDSLVASLERFHLFGRWLIAFALAAAVGRLAYRLLKRRKFGSATEATLQHLASEQAIDAEAAIARPADTAHTRD